MSWTRFGLRWRLLVVAGLALLPGFAVVLYQADQQYRHASAEARAEVMRFARLAADRQREAIDSAHALLSLLAGVPEVRPQQAAACTARLTDLFQRQLERSRYVTNILAAAPDGQVFCATFPLPEPVSLADRAYFRRVLETHGFVLGTFVLARPRGIPVLPFAVPVMGENRAIAAVLAAGLNLAWLAETFGPILPPDAALVMFDSDGTILARYPDHARWVGRAMPDAAVVRAALDGREGQTFEQPALDGTMRIWAVQRLDAGERTLFFAVGHAREAAFAAADVFLARGIVALAVALLLSLATAWALGRRLVLRPVQDLTDTARRLAEGDLTARVGAHGHDEIAVLGQTFNGMAAALDRRGAEREEAQKAIGTEIEERRRAEETLRAVIDEAPFAIVGLDPDRKVMIWNRAAERIFGYTADEVVGRLYPLVPPGGEAEFDDIFTRSAAGERLRNYVVRRRRKDGALVDIVFSGAPLYDAQGKLRGIVFVLEDVTERKLVEQQLRQAQKMEAVGQLTGGLAHDFNNMLMVIIGNLDLLVDDLQDSKQRALAETALTGALRSAELTRQLLAFSRRQTLQPKVVQINEFVAGMTKLLQRTLGETIDVELKLAADLWSAKVDPSQVESALMNLAVNARDAMPGGGRLTIETANKRLDEDYVALNPEAIVGDYVMLAVSDTGSGIPKEILERVFEPFFTTKDVGKGTGLGLSMVYGFIKQSGGHIKIYSEVGVGTTVRLYLPRATEGTEETGGDMPSEEAVQGRGETILVVDDNPEVRRTAVAQLERLGYRVREAANGPEAIAVLREGDHVDLLFTDVVMAGGMSGLDLAEQARALQPGIKILFASGFADSARNGGKFRDTDVLMSKPYRRQELAQKVRDLLGYSG